MFWKAYNFPIVYQFCKPVSIYFNTWVNFPVQVSLETTRSEIVCMCSHMTSFAGGFLVMPNKLDFKKDIAKFLTFWENPVGIIAVSVVLFLYIIIVIFARRKDRMDFLRVSSFIYVHRFMSKYTSPPPVKAVRWCNKALGTFFYHL